MLTGATAAGKEVTAARIGAVVVAVLVTATLWALYFGRDEPCDEDADAAGSVGHGRSSRLVRSS